MIGRTLAHYKILDKLGAGGMGEVYLAVDGRLERKIALKILPSRLAEDPRLVGRFEREAKTVAALNHPNIVTLHSVEAADGIRFLTMELVEGESLDSKISESGLPLERFFEIALPLVAAVAAAHESGVAHRDLKPANVMVTGQGSIKVLDFGLAKLLEPADGAVSLDSPTEELTREGLVMGTVPYMSPEQVQGLAVDQRTDVFSLGIVLYELVTGRRPFGGESSATVISALLRDTPTPLDELSPDLPQHLGRILRRCLEKDPTRRYQSARDLRIELEDLERETGSTRARPAAAAEQPRATVLAYLVLAIAAILVAVLAREWWTGRQESKGLSSPTPLGLTKLTGAPGLEDDPAWSPDGKFLAYTSDERGNLDIIVQPIGGDQPIRAFDSEADEALPAWSPDGRRIAFVSAHERSGRLRPGVGRGGLTAYILAGGGDLFVAPAFGGAPQRLVADAYDPAWSPDGRRIAFTAPGENSFDVWTVGSDGGEPQRLTFGSDAFHPAWSPGGESIAYGSFDTEAGSFNLSVIPVSGGAPTSLPFPTGVIVMGPNWSPDGRELLFSSDLGGRKNLWRVRAPTARSHTFGEPEQVTFGGGADVSPSVDSSSGRLAFATVTVDVSVWELDVESGVSRQVTFGTDYEGNPQLSPDGETLLVATHRSGEPEIWTYSLDGEPLARVGASVSVDFAGVWSPDGTSVAYTRREADGGSMAVYKELGALSETALLKGAFVAEWSLDGREILAARVQEDPDNKDIVAISIRDGSVRQLTFDRADNNFPTWSPDGRQILFNSTTGGTRRLWLLAADGGTPRAIPLGDSEDSHPRWSPTDPDAVVFLRNHAVLCLLRPSTGEVREFEVDIGPHVGLDYPSWSADGAKLYFSVAVKRGDIFVTEAE